ncbi:3958_t:CDS:2 [Funneliformis caledonium]|uniref:3958_t:CDS:1 n=1 Tax=Funneliformis caledonium TaxID=1117310 RepID=A0A9N8W0S6_9GLOM|nr:3958_t:CDS:2 [Funneliformis caledonium]
MNFDDLLGKQRKSEPRVVLVMRVFALLIISSCLISYITILIIDVNDEIPAIKTSEVPVDSIAIPDFAFSFGFSFQILCSFSWVNNEMRYIITPKYIQGLYRGSFSLNDQSYLFTSPKQDEWLDTLAFVVVADDPSFNAFMISVSPPYMPPYIQIFDPGAWGLVAAFYAFLFGASSIHPWGFIQSHCCGIKPKTQKKLRESLSILPLIDDSLSDHKGTAEEFSVEEFNQMKGRLKSLETLLREYVIDVKYLQSIENCNIRKAETKLLQVYP